MADFRQLPIRSSYKSSKYMAMRVKKYEFDTGCSFLELLPLELQGNIFRMLSNADIYNLTLVSKAIYTTVCESYNLMSRFKFIVPSVKDLPQIPRDVVQIRKYSCVEFRGLISYGHARLYVPYVDEIGHFINNAIFSNVIYSDVDFLNILKVFENLTNLTVKKQNDFKRVNGMLNLGEFTTATPEQIARSYTVNFVRLGDESLGFGPRLTCLKSLQVTIDGRLSLYVAAKLSHITLIHANFVTGQACQNIECFLEHQKSSLVSLGFKNHKIRRFQPPTEFANDKICRLGLNLRELIFDDFVIQDQNDHLTHVLSFIHSQQGSLVRLKLIRCDFLTVQSIPAFVAAASRIKELIIDSCADVSWLSMFLAQNVYLNLLHIKNTPRSTDVIRAIANNRRKIGQLIV